jgi:inner membrane protein
LDIFTIARFFTGHFRQPDRNPARICGDSKMPAACDKFKHMPTIFTHGAIGFAAARTFSNNPYNDRLVIASIVLAALPDVDGLFFRLIPYRHPLGHRGLTHSLLFAAVAGLITALIFAQKRWNDGHSVPKLAAFFTLVTASHGFFDAMTNGGLGVAFLAPFNNARYCSPYRPIPVSPMSVTGLLTERGWHVIKAELGLFWTFALAAGLWDRQSSWRMIAASLSAAAGVLAWLLAFRS